MIDHELTDPAGGALTITHDHQGVWITATEDRDEVTVGPFPARALRASFDMGDDLADGGVTAAAIEAEVVSPEQARSLVQENTSLRERIGQAEEEMYAARRFATREHVRATRAEQERAATASPRPLSADDITDEMRKRAGVAMIAWQDREYSLTHEQAGDMVLVAALAPPAENPEVVALAEVLGDFAVADEHTGDRDDVILARRLHERGVRLVVGNE